MATLFVTDGPGKGQKFSLAGCNLAMVGRDARCTFQITDPKLSRMHLQVRHDAGQGRHFAIDYQSKNGVLLNGQKLTEEALLNDRDILTLGDTAIVYASDDAEDAMKVFEAWKSPGQGNQRTISVD